MSTTDPERLPSDLGTTDRQDSTDAPAMVASSMSRHQEINFFTPQESSYLSLWTSIELKDTRMNPSHGDKKGNKTGSD